MAKTLKEYNEELKKITEGKAPTKGGGTINYPTRPSTRSVEDHIKTITSGRDNIPGNQKKRIK